MSSPESQTRTESTSTGTGLLAAVGKIEDKDQPRANTATGPPSAGDLPTVTLMVVGDTGAGKTSVLQRYLGNSFDSDTASTTEVVMWEKEVELCQQKLHLCVWDTPGGFLINDPIRAGDLCKAADGIIVVCDGSTATSLDRVPFLTSQIRLLAAPHTPALALFRTKCDLFDASEAVRSYDGRFVHNISSASDGGIEVKAAMDQVITTAKYNKNLSAFLDFSVPTSPVADATTSPAPESVDTSSVAFALCSDNVDNATILRVVLQTLSRTEPSDTTPYPAITPKQRQRACYQNSGEFLREAAQGVSSTTTLAAILSAVFVHGTNHALTVEASALAAEMLQHRAPDIQLAVLIDVLRSCDRWLEWIAKHGGADESSHDGCDSSSALSMRRRCVPTRNPQRRLWTQFPPLRRFF